MRLALFDLDHTLIPFDSGMALTRFLVRAGVLAPDVEARYLECCQQAVAGARDIHALHRACIAPLAGLPWRQLQAWLAEFEREVEPLVPASMRALVARHQHGGDLCAIVTATSRLVAEPFARSLGIAELMATESRMADGVPTGEILGLPCSGEHKITHVQAWLASRGAAPRALDDFEASWFYSDSASDLPLLRAVTHPVAVRPDARLRAHAEAAGWPVL